MKPFFSGHRSQPPKSEHSVSTPAGLRSRPVKKSLRSGIRRFVAFRHGSGCGDWSLQLLGAVLGEAPAGARRGTSWLKVVQGRSGWVVGSSFFSPWSEGGKPTWLCPRPPGVGSLSVPKRRGSISMLLQIGELLEQGMWIYELVSN